MFKIENIDYVTEVDGKEVARETGKVFHCDSPSDLAALFDLVMFGEVAE